MKAIKAITIFYDLNLFISFLINKEKIIFFEINSISRPKNINLSGKNICLCRFIKAIEFEMVSVRF